MKSPKGFAVTALLIGLTIAATAAAFWAASYSRTPQEPVEPAPTYGAFRPSGYVGKLLTRLNEGGSESTFNTTPGTTPDGQSLTTVAIGDFVVLTINPGAANEEKISASAVSISGTTATWTIINRGLSFASPTTTVTANKEQHAIGEVVIISNDDHFQYQQYVDVDAPQTISGNKIFSQGARFSVAASSTNECDTSTEYCTKNYIDSTANAGAATSTESNGGIVELGTIAEQADSYDGGSNKPTVLQTKNSTSTCQVVGSYNIVASSTTGKLDKGCFDQTAQYSISSSTINTFQSTNATTTSLSITDKFKVNTASASSSALTIDANGYVTANAPSVNVISTDTYKTSAVASTTVKTVAIPANTLKTTTALKVEAQFTNTVRTSGSCQFGISIGTGSATTSIAYGGPFNTGEYSSFSGTIFATSTSNQSSSFITYTVQDTGSTFFQDPTTLWAMVFTPYSNASILYLAFVTNASSATCALIGETVTAITNP